ncbi:MAG: oligopeptide transporter, OPT family [bacterium]
MNLTDPYIPENQSLPEFSVRAVILGTIISILFGLANAYLGLKVGMTVCASIPAAVIGMSVLRSLKNGTVLENNIIQTIGSTGESLAAGVIFTIPVFFIWSAEIKDFPFHITKWHIFFMSVLGGSLGILFMIPLRRTLVKTEHGKLPFPEGTACAEIIKAGDQGGSGANLVFGGMGIGALYQSFISLFKIWPGEINHYFQKLKGGLFGVDTTPALLGVGYIIGPRISSFMFAGALLGYLCISPLITFIGQHADMAIAPGEKPITHMNPFEIRSAYIVYIGTGGVVLAGFISLFRAFINALKSWKSGHASITTSRTDRDLPGKLIAAVSVIIVFLSGFCRVRSCISLELSWQ